MAADIDGNLPQILAELGNLQKQYRDPDGPAFLIVQYVQPDKGLASARRLGLKKDRTFEVHDLELISYLTANMKVSRSTIVVGWLGGGSRRWETFVGS